MALPDGRNRKQVITIQSSEVSGSGSHTDFPVLITLDHLDTEVVDGGSNSALNGGGDIAFSTDSAGSNQIPIEVVEFITSATPANRRCTIWIKVPSLSTSSNTEVYIWYNKTGESQPAVTAPFGRNAVWSDFEFMSHDLVTDSTGNYTGSNTISGDPTQIDGPFGTTNGGYDFDGTGDIIDVAMGGRDPFTGIALNDPISWGAYFANKTFDNFRRGVHIKGDGATGYTGSSIQLGQNVSISAAGRFWAHGAINGNAAAARYSALNESNAGIWQLVWASDSSFNENSFDNISLMIDGEAADTTGSTQTFGTGGTSPFIRFGARGDSSGGTFFIGSIAEAWMKKSETTNDWRLTSYNNHSTPSTFAIAGTPENASSGTTGTINVTTENSTLTATGQVGNNITGTISVTTDNSTLAATGQVGTTITGTISVTTDDSTLVASGQNGANISGTISVTTDNSTLTATGQVGNDITGTITATTADSMLGAVGVVGDVISGTINVTTEDSTLAATGTVQDIVTGTISVTTENSTLAATGQVGNDITGTITVTTEDSTLTASGQIGGTVTGTIAVTTDNSTLAATGQVGANITGTISVTTEDSTLAATGNIFLRRGTINVTTEDSTLAATGIVQLDLAGKESRLYVNFVNQFNSDSIDLVNDTIKAVPISIDYSLDVLDTYVSDISSYFIGTPQQIFDNKRVTSETLFDNDQTSYTWSGLTGNIGAIILFKDTGDPNTSELISYHRDDFAGLTKELNNGEIEWILSTKGFFIVQPECVLKGRIASFQYVRITTLRQELEFRS